MRNESLREKPEGSFTKNHSNIIFFLFFRNNRLVGFVAILWALGVSYSRIYVGKHYPFDVLVGILFGVLVGWLAYLILVKKIQNTK